MISRIWFPVLPQIAWVCALAGCSGTSDLQVRAVSTRMLTDVNEGDIVARRSGDKYAFLQVARLVDIELLRKVKLDGAEEPALLRQSEIQYGEGGRPSLRALLGQQALVTSGSLAEGFKKIRGMRSELFLANVCWVIPEDPSDDFVLLRETRPTTSR